MHPIILVCTSPFENPEPVIKALQNLGVEARATTLEEVKGEDLVVPEAAVIAIKTPDSYVLSMNVGARREGLLRRAAAIALISSASIANRGPIEIPEIPEPPKFEPKMALRMDVEDDFIFEKPKPNWPKAAHNKPSAQWKHRHHGFHPARSRDKARMR